MIVNDKYVKKFDTICFWFYVVFLQDQLPSTQINKIVPHILFKNYTAENKDCTKLTPWLFSFLFWQQYG